MTTSYRGKDGAIPDIVKLLDHLQRLHGIKRRGTLLDLIQTSAGSISKIMRGKEGVSARMILAIHDASGLPVNDIRSRLGIETVQPMPQRRV